MYAVDKDKVFWRKTEGETVILNIDTGYYYTLDEIGAFIWDMLINRQDLDQISAKVSDDYDIDYTTAQRDIKAIIKNLEREKLIEVK